MKKFWQFKKKVLSLQCEIKTKYNRPMRGKTLKAMNSCARDRPN